MQNFHCNDNFFNIFLSRQKRFEREFARNPACQLCDLHEQAKTVCVASRACDMPPTSQKTALLIIGEAPGRDEDNDGKPFVGRAGDLL